MTSASTGMYHVPVLPKETLAALALKPGLYLDATVGGGGHSRLLLEAEPALQVTAIDQDAVAIASAQARLASFGERVKFWRGNFAEFDPGSHRFDGILADLGVSSAHFDQPQRGFSFRHPAPLDMRMDQRQSLTAAEIVNYWNEVDLANLIYTLGEERLSRRIARQMVAQRPFQTTTDLAAAIAGCVPASYRHGRIHPATRTFQALRIAVNRELDVLDTLLQEAPHWLKPKGRLVIISFHSLEDRRVKHAFRASPLLTVISKKPIVAQPEEVNTNPRSRSAKLRVAERLP
ncbi:Ribosomal RNA small subunit methyltransferase H [Halomicronema hongdechloris C2206]|uniref:Ribosomal RNA small subunit methyltransferase H n=1 Tax=Halomicronema hongdechloris C2206 TaxID=1641165 RepID=A0A1Z3HPX3_9CYAN|nr:16S rRNA (cytosine(1402)-N(4))-methyltransferase RsmH [Halomicronema hongdechloris]ASC72217.1 Ribosomal RNA small subunit methyltransferase H [Halomicronema hongdechloris C2206]